MFGTFCACLFIMRNFLYTSRVILLIVAFSGLVLLCGGCGGGGGSVASTVKSTTAPVSSSDPITVVDQAKQSGKWTILVYMDADNDLESYAIDNINQMESVGSTKDVRIVVQIDRTPGYDSSNGDWTDTRRYLITKDNDPAHITSLRLDAAQPLGELDMADPRNLKNFVEWGAKTFPAEHYCVILWNHGTGWEFTIPTTPSFNANYVLSDDSSGNAMNVTDIPNALSTVKPDILAFDACYMQQVEIAYQLRNSAGYMVGSTGAVPSSGFNYSGFLSQISSNSSPVQVGESIVDTFMSANRNYKAVQMSMVDLSKMDSVAAAANQFSNTLLANQANWSSLIEKARAQSYDYSASGGTKKRYLIDLAGYADKCSNLMGSGIDQAASGLRQSVESAVVAEGHSSDSTGATGLSVFLPKSGNYDSAYKRLDFAKVTSWDNLISSM